MARDDFSQATVNALGKRVASRCSNPACGRITTGPHTDTKKVLNVGVAAHVTAASEGGPRYDGTLTGEQRKDISNAIWLCQTCSKLIDSDTTEYPADLLRLWRTQAEDSALLELRTGQPPAIDQAKVQFAVDSWRHWRERGNLPGDSVIFITGWGRGDLRFSCNIRLRNLHPDEEQLHSLRLQYRKETEILFEDEYAFSSEVILPSKKWQTIEVDHGLHGANAHYYVNSGSLWFAAELVGSPRTFAWKVFAFDHSVQIPVPGYDD